MLAIFTDIYWIRFFGVCGSLIIVAAALTSGLWYRGKQGQRYSPLNHYISELGETGVSKLAPVFNGGLILGGLLLIPFCVGLGLLIGGVLAWLALIAGCLAAIAVACVGIFPMNNLNTHIPAAMTYFRFGLVMVFLFTVAILSQPADKTILPAIVNLAGGAAFLAYASFLMYTRVKTIKGEKVLDPEKKNNRPRLWILPALEWSIFITTMVWFFVIAASLSTRLGR